MAAIWQSLRLYVAQENWFPNIDDFLYAKVMIAAIFLVYWSLVQAQGRETL